MPNIIDTTQDQDTLSSTPHTCKTISSGRLELGLQRGTGTKRRQPASLIVYYLPFIYTTTTREAVLFFHICTGYSTPHTLDIWRRTSMSVSECVFQIGNGVWVFRRIGSWSIGRIGVEHQIDQVEIERLFTVMCLADMASMAW